MDDRDRKGTAFGNGLGRVVLGVLALALSAPTFAVDGVIEINQAKALAGDVTAGDFAGFPVYLNAPGSYRLTSDLTVPAGVDGIVVEADDVTLDLNGFNLVGGGGTVADGISIANDKNVEIRNGTIKGFSRGALFTNIGTFYIRVIGVRAIGNTTYGIDLQGDGNLIDGCTAINNGSNGLRVFEGSLVINSVARGHSSVGLALGISSGYRSNVLTGNNGGNANAQVSGGIQLGSNVCGNDSVCP